MNTEQIKDYHDRFTAFVLSLAVNRVPVIDMAVMYEDGNRVTQVDLNTIGDNLQVALDIVATAVRHMSIPAYSLVLTDLVPGFTMLKALGLSEDDDKTVKVHALYTRGEALDTSYRSVIRLMEDGVERYDAVSELVGPLNFYTRPVPEELEALAVECMYGLLNLNSERTVH